ncbi:hypothetical protein ES703_58769 [subsurface metagenome]
MKCYLSREKASYFFPLNQAGNFLIDRDSRGMFNIKRLVLSFLEIRVHPWDLLYEKPLAINNVSTYYRCLGISILF